MGRQSTPKLNLAATSLPGQRPPPPDMLSEPQAEIWRSVVSCLPHDWFSPDNLPLLVEYCRHVDRANRLNAVVQRMLDDEDELEGLSTLLSAAKKESDAIVSLARQMRLSQQSRYVADKAAVAASRATREAQKPWEQYKTGT